jgi:hypothetical protein
MDGSAGAAETQDVRRRAVQKGATAAAALVLASQGIM